MRPVIDEIFENFLRYIYNLSPNIKGAVIRVLLFLLVSGLMLTFSRRHLRLRSPSFQILLMITGFFLAFSINLDLFNFAHTLAYGWFMCLCFLSLLILPGILPKVLVPTRGGQTRTKYILYTLSLLAIMVEIFR